MYLRSIAINRKEDMDRKQYPFSIPVIASLTKDRVLTELFDDEELD